MNSISIFNNILRAAIRPCLIAPSNILLQQTRNTVILKRRNPLPLHRKNSMPQRFKRRHYIYDMVENTDVKKKEPLKVILTQLVSGVGEAGDVIYMSPLKAYNQLLLPGLAVYASPENVEKYKVKSIDVVIHKKTHFTERTVDILSQYLLNVVMSADNPWTLEKWHLRSSFRKAGIYLNDDCIIMPKRPISGPDFTIENKEFYVTVKINNTVEVIVRCRIHHWSNDPHKKIPFVTDFYLKPSEPIYPEDKSVLDSLPMPYLMAKNMKKDEAPKTY